MTRSPVFTRRRLDTSDAPQAPPSVAEVPVHALTAASANFFDARTFGQVLVADCVGPLTRSAQGHSSVLQVVDVYTRYVWTFPLRSADGPGVSQGSPAY